MLTNKCVQIIHVLFFLVAAWVNIIVLGISIKKYSVFFIVIVSIMYGGYNWVKRNKDFCLEHICFTKRKEQFFYFLLLIAFFLMLLIAFSLEVDVYNTWDYGQLIRSAYETVINGKLENTAYFARYPNNSFYMLILSSYFKCISAFAKDNIYNYLNATIPINCILVALSILFTYLTAKIFLTEKAAFRCGMIMLGLSPLYVYSTIAYTDVFAIFPASLILFLYMKGKTEKIYRKRMVWFCLLAMLTAVGYKIKATLIIFFVAIVIDISFSIIKRRKYFLMLIIYISVFFVSIGACTTVSTEFLYNNGVTEGMRQEEEFPITHWFMMGINPRYSGGFNQEDVDYTKSHIGRESKVSANITEIEERLKNMKAGGTIKHVLIKKVARMWGSGDCSGSDYVSRLPRSNNIWRQVFSLGGHYNYIYRLCAQLYYAFVIMAIFRTAVSVMKNREINKGFMVELTFLGVFMFFLIWECNSRYLFVFLPVLVLLIFSSKERGESVWEPISAMSFQNAKKIL